MEWSAWAGELEKALGPEGDFPSFFAPGALFSDPVNAPTPDIAAIEEMTKASFPDWRQEILWVHGDESGGAFEWIGRGTLGGTVPIEIHGVHGRRCERGWTGHPLARRLRPQRDRADRRTLVVPGPNGLRARYSLPAQACRSGPRSDQPEGAPPAMGPGPGRGNARPTPARVSSVQ